MIIGIMLHGGGDRLSIKSHAWEDTLDEIKKTVFVRQQLEMEEAQRIETDPVFKLEDMLKHHDWYHTHSDDHNVFLRGDESLARIKAMRHKMSDKIFNSTWNKYCPWTNG